MTKKEYILKVLENLKESWPLAPGLLVLVQNWSLDDSTIDALTDIFKEAIKNVADKVKRNELQAGIDKLQEIKNAEKEAFAQDKKELDAIEEMFE